MIENVNKNWRYIAHCKSKSAKRLKERLRKSKRLNKLEMQRSARITNTWGRCCLYMGMLIGYFLGLVISLIQ